MSDRLPPHSLEAEAGVLGCMLIDPASCLERARKVIESDTWFYDIRHHVLWRAMLALFDAGGHLDTLTLLQRLKDFGNLEDAGGAVYLATLPDATPSPTHLDAYLQILKEKFLARRMLKVCHSAAANIMDFEGSLDAMIDRVRDEFVAIDESRQNAAEGSTRIRKPTDYAEDHYNLWFGTMAGEPGLDLPFGLPWRVREGELTLVMGENGAGKSTILLFVINHLLAHPESKVLVASMEVRPEITLKMMASQLIGATKLGATPDNQRLVNRAISWLQHRVLIYDFLGIVHWRTLLQTMEHCAEHKGVNIVLIDSLMRLGIPDDDYSQQGQCVQTLASFSMKHRAHTFLVNHLNKSDRDGKSRNRGSGQITDNAHNIISIERNESKWIRIDNLRDSLAAGSINQQEYTNAVSGMTAEWDTCLRLLKQRWPGSRQNGSKRLWFDGGSLQYSDRPHPQARCLIDDWERHPKQKKLQAEREPADIA